MFLDDVVQVRQRCLDLLVRGATRQRVGQVGGCGRRCAARRVCRSAVLANLPSAILQLPELRPEAVVGVLRLKLQSNDDMLMPGLLLELVLLGRRFCRPFVRWLRHGSPLSSGPVHHGTAAPRLQLIWRHSQDTHTSDGAPPTGHCRHTRSSSLSRILEMPTLLGLNQPLPTIVIRLPAWSTATSLVVGIGIATLILSLFSIEGFAPDGCFPTMAALLYAAAIGLVSLPPVRPVTVLFRPKRT